MYDIMTPGPTQVGGNVLAARALPCTNPDLDPDFFTFYKETCELISSLLHTGNQTLILDGEGILGLEAACASLTEPGDRVLVLDNGVFGKGFAIGVGGQKGAQPVPFVFVERQQHAISSFGGINERIDSRIQTQAAFGSL